MEVKEQIEKMALKEFKDHVLTKINDNCYLCKNPTSGMYKFYITFIPEGAIAITGDLYEDIYVHYNKDSISWLRGSIHSPGYMYEKSRMKFKGDYDKDKAREWIIENIEEKDREILFYCDYQSKFDEEYYDLTGDSEGPNFEGYGSQFYWHIEAFKKFLELYDKTL